MMKLRFTLRLGMFARKRVRREIEAFCFERDMKCSVLDWGGFFVSTYGFEVEGSVQEDFNALTDFLKAFAGSIPLEAKKA